MKIFYKLFFSFFFRFFRKKRGKILLKIFPNISKMKILDVGGSNHFWDEVNLNINPKNITLLNIKKDNFSNNKKIKTVIYDGKNFPFGNNEFDLIICNSVIEHVEITNRVKLANEIKRVGRSYFIQTPNYDFFLDPHFMLPFIHWMPKKLGYFYTYLSFLRYLSGASRLHLKDYFLTTYLLKSSEMISLFNENIIFEKFLFMNKSIISYYKSNN